MLLGAHVYIYALLCNLWTRFSLIRQYKDQKVTSDRGQLVVLAKAAVQIYRFLPQTLKQYVCPAVL